MKRCVLTLAITLLAFSDIILVRAWWFIRQTQILLVIHPYLTHAETAISYKRCIEVTIEVWLGKFQKLKSKDRPRKLLDAGMVRESVVVEPSLS